MLRHGADPKYAVYSLADLAVPLYRVVLGEEATGDDFKSYVLAGKPFPTKLFFRATGVSMFIEKKQAEKLARGGRLGTYVAKLEIGDIEGHFTLTNEITTHVTVWAMSRLLLQSVVSCAEVGKA